MVRMSKVCSTIMKCVKLDSATDTANFGIPRMDLWKWAVEEKRIGKSWSFSHKTNFSASLDTQKKLDGPI